MARIRRLSRSLAATAAVAALCLAFHDGQAVAAERESNAVGVDAPVSDKNVGPNSGDGPQTGDTESRATYGGKSGSLPSRTSLEAPRGAEGIRRRLAAGRGGASSEQDGSEVAVNQDNNIELDDHASTGTCKRREGWGDDGAYTAAVDVCGVGGLDVDQCVHQGGGRAAAGEGVGAAAGEAPLVTEEMDCSNGQQVPPPPRIGIAESSNSSIAPDGGGGLSAVAPGMGNSNEVQFAPELEHDPWEGYQIIAQADPVTSWEILREVRNSCTLLILSGMSAFYS